MLTIYELRELVKLLEQTDVESIEVKHEDARLAIKRRTTGSVVQTTPTAKVVVAPVKAVVPTPVAPVKPVVEVARPTSVETPKAPAQPTENTENLHKVTSPMVGTFYAAPAADAAPYVSVGSRVEKSTIVCIVEAMKLFNEIEAEVSGEIVQVLVENGQLVDLGQPLFLVKTAQ
ncbi:acetyl-CoA carboxylase biotin carboxyl carrier protein subunit [Brevibacillus choshinensis]|uniref:Biotin carboxyl carrier protein of acetyl-CoA carboxylase n=1 Tax=Brevibacillus choshinensis TaxID=54911 RepID=A0ABR5ND90_BRECH|nr:acetyl-CoA carboxylase biotin carboxyl carrier protein [Brevibacillus choshinensis]KQL49522.1 acetyl-CoA carboxylase biotin carboxyl carrier protein subunit [Brevibacillus choshinensis]